MEVVGGEEHGEAVRGDALAPGHADRALPVWGWRSMYKMNLSDHLIYYIHLTNRALKFGIIKKLSFKKCRCCKPFKKAYSTIDCMD